MALALALELSIHDVRGVAVGTALVNVSIRGFLKHFHFFSSLPELAATAYTVPLSAIHASEKFGATKLFCRHVLPTVLGLRKICLLDHSADGLSPPQWPPD